MLVVKNDNLGLCVWWYNKQANHSLCIEEEWIPYREYKIKPFCYERYFHHWFDRKIKKTFCAVVERVRCSTSARCNPGLKVDH